MGVNRAESHLAKRLVAERAAIYRPLMQEGLLILAGIVLLTLGGELLVRGSVATARWFGVSPLLIGLTFVGFGTSTPELVTSVQASLAGSPGIALGNIVGSNIANLLLALGIAAVIAPIPVGSRALGRDGGLLLGITLGFSAVSLFLPLSLPIGMVLLAGLVAYLALAFAEEQSAVAKLEPAAEERIPSAATRGKSLYAPTMMAVGGLISLLSGAHLLVDSSVTLAAALGIPDTVIGLTVVAVGTSLPEAFTSALAAYRRQPEVAFGNAIGSCLYNLLGIGGVTAILAPIPVPDRIASFDNPIMLAATLLVLAFGLSRRRIDRLEGLVLLTGYLAYLVWTWLA